MPRYRSGEVDRSRSVTVDADRPCSHGDHRPVDRDDLVVDGETDGPFGHLVGIGEHAVGLAARHQTTVGPVRTIGECLRDAFEPGGVRSGEQLRAGQTEDRERRVELGGGLDERSGGGRVGRRRVVQRAVGLDVGDLGAGDLGERVERTELVQHGVAEFLRCHVEVAAAEAGQIGEGDLSADRHVVLHGESAGRPQDRRVAGMEATRDVRAGDDAEHGGIVAERPDPVGLPQVTVDVDGDHGPMVRLPGSPCQRVMLGSWPRARSESSPRTTGPCGVRCGCVPSSTLPMRSGRSSPTGRAPTTARTAGVRASTTSHSTRLRLVDGSRGGHGGRNAPRRRTRPS